MRLNRLLIIALCGVAAACNSSTSTYGSSGGTAQPGANQVFMQGTAFNPTTRTVAAGTTITWVNQDPFTHTVNWSSGADSSFASGNVPAGGSFSHTFNGVGTVQYYCSIHGTPTTGMHATIVVQ